MPGSRGLLTCRDLKSGNPISTGLVRNARCDAVALDAHGKIIATGQGHEVDLWSLETGLHLRSLKAHPTCTSVSLAFSPDGSLLISSGVPPPDEETRGQVVIWRVVDGAELLRQEGGADVVGFCKDGKEFATQEGGEIRVNDTKTGRIVWTRTGDEVSTSALSQRGSRLIIGTTKGVVEVWDPVRRNLVLRKRVGNAPIVAVAVA
ncbi:MAG: WD40 repeat domain-containing protein, partial [Actinomycetota bacterium]